LKVVQAWEDWVAEQDGGPGQEFKRQTPVVEVPVEAIEDDEEKVSKAVTPVNGSTAGKTPGASAPALEKDGLESSPDAGKPVEVKPQVVETEDGKPKRKPRRTTRKIKEEADEDGPPSVKKRKGEHGVDISC
jgi:hypothetical protein